MTIEFQPRTDELYRSRSPILYLVTDPNYNQPDFRYVFDVFIWTGAIGSPGSRKFQIKRQPRLDGKCSIDISQLVMSYLPIIDIDQARVDDHIPSYFSGNGQVYFKVEISAEWTGGSVAPVVSNIARAVDGFSYPEDGTNFSITRNRIISSDSSVFVGDSGDVIMSVALAGTLPGAGVTTRYRQGGSVLASHSWGAYTNNHTSFSLVHFNVGNPDGGVDRTKPYQVLIDIDTIATQVLNVIPVCTREEEIPVVFMNRSGGLESHVFSGRSDYSFGAERSQLSVPGIALDMVQDFTGGQMRQFNTKGTESITANTTLLPETQNETMKQILFSEYIQIDLGSKYIRTLIETNSIQKKTSVSNQAMIQFSMNFKIGFDQINSAR